MREARQLAGATQAEAAAVARCSYGTISNAEAGRADLSAGQIADLRLFYLQRIAARLSCLEQIACPDPDEGN